MTSRLETLFRTVEQLGEATGIALPADETRLGILLGAHLSIDDVSRVLGLLRHPNMHARRVALQAIRRAAFWSSREVATAVVERLDDPEGWVRYDAARALGTSNEHAPDVIEALRRLAGGASPRDTLDIDDDAQQARIVAAKALMDLGARTE